VKGRKRTRRPASSVSGHVASYTAQGAESRCVAERSAHRNQRRALSSLVPSRPDSVRVAAVERARRDVKPNRVRLQLGRLAGRVPFWDALPLYAAHARDCSALLISKTIFSKHSRRLRTTSLGTRKLQHANETRRRGEELWFAIVLRLTLRYYPGSRRPSCP